MGSRSEEFFSLVPKGSAHEVEGERVVMLPGISLEIFATRKIRLRRWNLRRLLDPFWRLYLPIQGKAVIECEGRETPLEPGFLYLIPPRTPISSHNPEPFTKWYVHFVLGRSDLLSVPGVYPQPLDKVAESLLESLEAGSRPSFRWESATLLSHALGKLPASAWTERKLDPRVVLAMQFLEANLSRRLGAKDAARAANLSVRSLNHLFRKQLRVSPMAVLLSYRLDRACQLLRHTDQSIEQVAENCGFPNRSYFSRMLKQHRGVSPAAYRRGHPY